jgi:hypothetical protein
VYSKLSKIFAIPVALLMATTVLAQAPTPASSTGQAATSTAAVGSTTIRGKIADPTGALIPGAQITISNSKGQTVATATADASGSYEVHTASPGTYSVTATYDGFAPFVSQGIVVAAGQIKRIDITMAIETTQQTVTVTDETPTVSVEADNNGNAMVIKGKDLDALSDDPDELSNELSALAGPSAGPNGGQIYIDGFTGGQLPPKSSIREIRVNQNPYSAEYDKLGFGRIEILTKPGTDHLHGQFMIQGNDSSFNTGDPFTRNIPPYYSYQYNGTLNGSLNKNTSFFISADHRTTDNEAYYDTPCNELGVCTTAGFSGTLANPHSRTNISPRIDLQIGAKNTLTARYQYYHDSESGDINATQLPSLSNSSTSNDNSIQISDTQVINDHVVNETRFQYDRSIESTTPVSTDPFIQVQQGSFSAGGNSSQSTRDHTDRWEFQNLTTMSLGKHAVKFGTRLRDSRDANYSDGGFNGSFTFNLNSDYTTAVNTPVNAAPTQLSYSAGTRSVVANVFDGAAFIQDDWRFSQRLTLSGGIRWESQNHVADHDDWAPRISMAYALDGKKGKQAKTVLRAGYGIFYDRLGLGNLFTINRASVQSQFILTNPVNAVSGVACFSPTSFVAANCASSDPATQSRIAYQVSPNYRSPYTQQFGASIERQVTKTSTATLTYLHSTGVHQLVEVNTDAPLTPDSGSTGPAQYQYLPEGIYKQDQLILNARTQFTPNLGVFGFYTLSFAHTDGAGGAPASNSLGDGEFLGQDYGRATFVSRNQVFLIGNYTGKWGIRYNPFLIASSGKPFNITTGSDRNGDSFFNDRPYVASSSECSSGASGFYQTAYGCLDANNTPLAGETLLANNAGNGPAAVALNLRISRAFGIGPKLNKVDPNANQGGGPPGGGPPGGGRGGPGGGGPGGGFGPGGFGGSSGGRGGPGGMFGPTSTGRKYNLNFSVQALNLFNDIDKGTPVGTVTAEDFGKSRSLQGGIFSSGSAARRVFLQATFSF